jgi:hypothetical protein
VASANDSDALNLQSPPSGTRTRQVVTREQVQELDAACLRPGHRQAEAH